MRKLLLLSFLLALVGACGTTGQTGPKQVNGAISTSPTGPVCGISTSPGVKCP